MYGVHGILQSKDYKKPRFYIPEYGQLKYNNFPHSSSAAHYLSYKPGKTPFSEATTKSTHL